MPARPPTRTNLDLPGPTGSCVPRVSRIRVGETGKYLPWSVVRGAHGDGASSGLDVSTAAEPDTWPGTGPPSCPHQFDVAMAAPLCPKSPPTVRSARVPER